MRNGAAHLVGLLRWMLMRLLLLLPRRLRPGTAVHSSAKGWLLTPVHVVIAEPNRPSV
jgi:hypothetical protein